MPRPQRRFLRSPFNLPISMASCVRSVRMGPPPFRRCRPRPTRDGRPTLCTSSLIFCLSTARRWPGPPSSKERNGLKAMLEGAPRSVRYSDHHIGDGQRFLQAACGAKAEGIISKRVDAPYVPGDRGLWRKAKCYQREEFVIVGYSEPEGSRPYIGALLLAYYDDADRLVYAVRVGTGMSGAELRRVYGALQPLRTPKMPLDAPPSRTSRFGSPLNLSRVAWVRPKLVCEVRFLTWTADGLVRQGAYEGLRSDKPAKDVRRPRPA